MPERHGARLVGGRLSVKPGLFIALLLLLASCSPTPRPAAVPSELSIEEHLLTQAPEAEYGQLYFADGTQEEILSLHAAEREKLPDSRSTSCTIGNQLGQCLTVGQNALAAWTEYSPILNTGKVIVSENAQWIDFIPVGDMSPIDAIRGIWTYSGHWVLETAYVRNHIDGNEVDSEPSGQITVDGTLLNKKYGYEEAFGFQTLHGKPFYFFKKSGKINVSYAGVNVATGYDEVHHYGCCSAATLNPDVYQNMVAFFARKGSAWYYIEIGVFDPSATPAN